MATLEALPSELLIMICQELDIPTLFNLRLAHPRLAVAIVESSINIASLAAANTWTPLVSTKCFKETVWYGKRPPIYLSGFYERPDYDQFLHVFCSRPHERPDFQWLKRIPIRLNAAVTVEMMLSRFNWEASFPCPESVIRDTLECRVEDGWLIINSLSLISRQYTSQTDRLRTHLSKEMKAGWRNMSANHFRIATKCLKKDQACIAAQFKAYLMTLPKRRLENYWITMSLLKDFRFTCWPKNLLYATQFTRYDKFPFGTDHSISVLLRIDDSRFWTRTEHKVRMVKDFTPLNSDMAYVKLLLECKPCKAHIIPAMARLNRKDTPQIPIWIVEPIPHEDEALAMATIDTGAYHFFLNQLKGIECNPIASESPVMDFIMGPWLEDISDYRGALKAIRKTIRSNNIRGDSWVDIIAANTQRYQWTEWVKRPSKGRSPHYGSRDCWYGCCNCLNCGLGSSCLFSRGSGRCRCRDRCDLLTDIVYWFIQDRLI